MGRFKLPRSFLQELENRLFYTFKDPQILQRAITHKSFANEGRQKGLNREAFVRQHNERLEFLGDSVLGLIISDLLSEKFPEVDEGKLSKMRSSLVKEDTLAIIARKLGLGPDLLLGKGEDSTSGRDKDSILSSAYEAVLGAIYLDGGFSAAYAAAEKHFGEILVDVDAFGRHDTKTQLQELSQGRFHKSPRYEVVKEIGPDHEKEFEVMVSVGKLQRFGKGRNKKEAEQAAARYLLEALKENPEIHAAE